MVSPSTTETTEAFGLFPGVGVLACSDILVGVGVTVGTGVTVDTDVGVGVDIVKCVSVAAGVDVAEVSAPQPNTKIIARISTIAATAFTTPSPPADC
jgi:hypothetical protein